MDEIELDISLDDSTIDLDISFDTNVTVTPSGSSPDIVYGGENFIE